MVACSGQSLQGCAQTSRSHKRHPNHFDLHRPTTLLRVTTPTTTVKITIRQGISTTTAVGVSPCDFPRRPGCPVKMVQRKTKSSNTLLHVVASMYHLPPPFS